MISDAGLPKRQTKGSAGYDFYMPYNLNMEVGKWYTIDTGVKFDGTEKVLMRTGAEPRDDAQWYMMIVPRSGLSFKYGFRIRNTVAIIDQDYRDTIKLRVCVDGPLTNKDYETRYEVDDKGEAVEEPVENFMDCGFTAVVPKPFVLHLNRGDRFAQGIIMPYLIFADEETPVNERNGGHGSTGV